MVRGNHFVPGDQLIRFGFTSPWKQFAALCRACALPLRAAWTCCIESSMAESKVQASLRPLPLSLPLMPTVCIERSVLAQCTANGIFDEFLLKTSTLDARSCFHGPSDPGRGLKCLPANFPTSVSYVPTFSQFSAWFKLSYSVQK